jgi:hypothetical protein
MISNQESTVGEIITGALSFFLFLLIVQAVYFGTHSRMGKNCRCQ